MGRVINTVECRNLLTGERAWFLVESHNWESEARAEARNAWCIADHHVAVKNCSKERAA